MRRQWSINGRLAFNATHNICAWTTCCARSIRLCGGWSLNCLSHLTAPRLTPAYPSRCGVVEARCA